MHFSTLCILVVIFVQSSIAVPFFASAPTANQASLGFVSLGCLAFNIGCPSWYKPGGGATTTTPWNPFPGTGTGTGTGAPASQAFRDAALARSNALRKLHCAAPLTEDPALTAAAQAYADKLANGSPWAHSPAAIGGAYGENLYQSMGITVNGETAVNAWYGEEKFYDYNNPVIITSGSNMNGHFTAVVWKSTTKVGFGTATKNGVTYVVANYSPAGNYPQPILSQNVDRPRC